MTVRLFSSIETSASGLTAERFRLDLIASNLANAEASGEPYRRKIALFAPRQARYSFRDVLGAQMSAMGQGVRVAGVGEDISPLKRTYMPGHPDADDEGYVT